MARNWREGEGTTDVAATLNVRLREDDRGETETAAAAAAGGEEVRAGQNVVEAIF